MAYSNNPGPTADSGMYDDAGPSEKPIAEGEEQHEEGGTTAVLPKAILAGKKFNVGDEVVLRIDAFQGHEVVVSYAQEKPEEGEEAPPERPPPPPPGGGGDEMGTMMG
jgi:hypothetical protein